MLAQLLLLFSFAAYGGWATITIEDVPTHLVAGWPVRLTFVVRQHGTHPLDGLEPQLEAVASGGGGGGVVTARGTPAAGGGAGRYQVLFTVPTPGTWTITINSGFGPSRVTLDPMAVIAPGAAAPATPPDAARGRQLFVAKGCATCHLYAGVSDGSLKVGPELTEPRFTAAYLARLLADPAKVLAERPRTTSFATMPNLELKPAEIAALSAFLAGPGAR